MIKIKAGTRKYLIASSVMIGSCIGAGVLGIPYVAAKSGFFVALFYIVMVGILIYTVNSFLGEVALRTKGDHQLIGYVQKYLGMKARHVMEFAFVFGVYSALIAYMLGMGKSLSYLIFGNLNHTIILGIGIGLIMSYLLWGGINSLKKFEKIGVIIILGLLTIIVAILLPKVVLSNITGFNSDNMFAPFGVVIFALMSFQSIPQLKIILKGNEKKLKKVLKTGTLVSVIFYSLFTFVVVGVKGVNTPDIATLTLGPIFIILGIFTMFTSYLSNGDALRESFQFDERYSKKSSWFLSTILPIGIFVLTQLTNLFSFTTILSIGGVVTGGTIAILSLLMVRRAKIFGNRKPEYEMPSNKWFIAFLIFIFLAGIFLELI